MKSKEPKIIVSLTSHPPRIKYVKNVIDLLKKQTLRPDKTILYLAQEDFPKGIEDLPKNLIREINDKNLEVKFIELDLKPHNKYFYVMQEYPQELIVTVDDDILLPETAIEELYESWLKNKGSIIARRAHLMTFNNDGVISPYNDWIHEFDVVKDTPTLQLFATGCGGVLYPPNCFPNTSFDSEAIQATSLYGDDIWLKAQEIINNIPVSISSSAKHLKFIGDSQDHSLIEENGENQRNDIYIKNIGNFIDEKFKEKNYISKILMNPKIGNNLYDYNNIFTIIKKLDTKQKKLEKKINKKIHKEIIRISGHIIRFPNKLIRTLKAKSK